MNLSLTQEGHDMNGMSETRAAHLSDGNIIDNMNAIDSTAWHNSRVDVGQDTQKQNAWQGYTSWLQRQPAEAYAFARLRFGFWELGN